MASGLTPGRAAPEEARARMERALARSQLFARAAPETSAAALAAAEPTIAFAGDVVVEQGSAARALLVIGQGRARLERAATGDRVVPLGYRGPGELIGDACLSGAAEHGERASAMDDLELVRLPVAIVATLLARDAALGMAAIELLLARQRAAEDRLASLLFRDVGSRLAELLVAAADRWGVPTPKGMLIAAPLTHLEIARTIGATRESVTLALGALRREGILDVTGRRLVVRDRAALAAR